MSWDAFGAISELIGALAVLTSLIYLSHQLRHGAESNRISNYHTTMAAASKSTHLSEIRHIYTVILEIGMNPRIGEFIELEYVASSTQSALDTIA